MLLMVLVPWLDGVAAPQGKPLWGGDTQSSSQGSVPTIEGRNNKKHYVQEYLLGERVPFSG